MTEQTKQLMAHLSVIDVSDPSAIKNRTEEIKEAIRHMTCLLERFGTRKESGGKFVGITGIVRQSMTREWTSKQEIKRLFTVVGGRGTAQAHGFETGIHNLVTAGQAERRGEKGSFEFRLTEKGLERKAKR